MVLIRAAFVSPLTLAILAIAGPMSSVAQAGEIWDGGGADSNWTTGPNWNQTGLFQVRPPNNGTANIHMAGNDNTSPNVDVPYSINSLTFDAGSVSFFLSGEELTIGAGGVTNNDNSTQLVLAPVKLGAAQTWTAAGSSLLGSAINLNGKDLTMGGAFNTTLNGAISDLSSTGLGGLTLPFGYAATVTLSGSSSNTYGGITRVKSGTLVLSKTGGDIAIPGELEVIKEAFTTGVTAVRLTADEQISHASNRDVKFWSHTLLDLNGHIETIARLFLSGSNVNVTTGSGKLIVGEFIRGSGGVGDEPTITGNVDLNGGQPTIGTPDNGLGGLVINGPISNGGAIFGNSVHLRGAANTYTGPTVVTGSVHLNKPVDGAFRGDVTITGYLELDANEQILAAPGNEVLIDGGNVQLNTFSETIQDLKIQGLSEIRGTGTLTVLGAVTAFGGSISVPLNLAGTRVLDVQGTLSATKTVSNGSLVKTGPGVLRLHYVPNTYSGGTFINAGTVIASDEGLGNPAGAINFNGGLLGANGTTFSTTARTMTWGPNGGGFDISAAGTFTINTQNLSGPGPLTKAGAGKLVLATPQSYTGGTTVAAGTLEGHTQSLQGNIVNNAALTFNQVTDGTYAGNLSGPGTLSKLGAGGVLLAGINSYSGITAINAGTLELAGGSAIGDHSTVTLANAAGALLDLADSNETIGALAGGGASGGNVDLGAGTLTTGGNNASTTYAGVISGAGGVAKTGGGVFTPTGVNTYTGGTTLAAGVLSASSDAQLGDAAGPLRFDGGTLRVTAGLAATPRTVELLSGGGLDIANAANLFTYSGTITGPGTLTKLGPGKLVLLGPNSYTGGTAVIVGTLEGNTGSLQGNILNNATVVFNQASDGTYAGNLSGVGEVFKIGAGAFTLTGASTGSGAITVDEGVLRVATGGQIADASILYVGDSGGGSLHVVGGGQVASDAGVIGNQNGATGEVIIDGVDSKWTIASDVNIGNTGAAAVDVINGGTIQAPSINVGPLGIVGGDGHLVGNLQNGGLVSPGTSPGALRLDGNYAQTPAGELLIELASASSYDQLLITQDATLAGTLMVKLIGGFTPSAGQTFTLLTTDDVDFMFETELLPSVPGVTFDVIYNAQSVVLTVLPAFTADFDNDGDVDSGDLAQWQGDFGVNFDSDADNDGDSDGADFLAWQQQLGGGLPATGAVPEPAATVLIALGLLIGVVVRPPRRSPLR